VQPAAPGGFELMKRLIGQALVLGTLVSVPAAAIANPASPLDDKKEEKSKDKDKKEKEKGKDKKKSPAPAPSH
jgi:ribosomal protein L12E/L44/L45/RPP1/RPP2